MIYFIAVILILLETVLNIVFVIHLALSHPGGSAGFATAGMACTIVGLMILILAGMLAAVRRKSAKGCTVLVHTTVKSISVQKIETGTNRQTNFIPVCEYTWNGNTVSVTPELLATTSITEYQPGQTIDMYISPDDPARYRLVHSSGRSGLLMTGLVFTVVGIICYILSVV